VIERVKEYGNIVELEELSKLGVFILEIPAQAEAKKTQDVMSVPGVWAVEPDYFVQAVDTIPNDPKFANQYGLISIRAPQGWDLSTGSNSVTIAIVDSGVDLGHVELVSKLTAGYDFVNNDSVPNDDFGHGTHVAGIAAASGNNGVGIAGVSWGARIMPIKVLDSHGNGTYANVAMGISWAVDHGAQVINMSLGGTPASAVLQSAVTYAQIHNVLMVAATGNSGSSFVLYPARYPEVMAVGASNLSNQPAGFSNHGPEVDVAAPGENIYSLWPGGYSTLTGTSMSAPHVSGLAAILFGYVSSADSVRTIIDSTALDIGPAGWDQFSGAGLIQMDAALAQVVPATATPTITATSTGVSNPNGGGVDSSSSSGGIPGYPFPTPTRTFTPLASLTPVTPTQTLSALEAAPAFTASISPTPTSAPVNENKINRLKIFFSPLFCTAVILIFLGILLFLRSRNTKRPHHNKFVM